MSAALSWLAQLVTNLTAWALRLLTGVLNWFGELVTAVLKLLIDLGASLLVWASGFLMDIPPGFHQGPIPDLLVQANYFLPLGTIASCLTVYGTYYAGSYLYKFAKFVRAGG